MDIQRYINRIFSIKSENEFESLSLEAFHYQVENCAIYSDFVRQLKKNNPRSYKEIPFLPISFFKSHQVLDRTQNATIVFKSSGTTGMDRSHHFVANEEIYIQSFIRSYTQYFGDIKNCVFTALLPNYMEQGDSSLIYMIRHIISLTEDEYSGFYLNNISDLEAAYKYAISSEKKFVLFGVSYALLDLIDQGIRFPNALIFETGGMKGRREEWSKERLHEVLCNGFGVDQIASEYGMTELLSQAYSTGNGLFSTPQWMKILFRDINDPFSYVSSGKTGGLNIIDLANIHSCSFIATQDLGREQTSGFQLMGRFDQADLRGCNMLVQ